MRGYAVVDVETTGFSFKHGHRIVEIGVVELDASGAVENTWETLVNPQRHMDATSTHHITAADVCGAPTFEHIADKLVHSLTGRLLVAHNAPFDSGFIQSELRRCGRATEDSLPAIDTMALAKQYLRLPSVKLAECCKHLGITNAREHAALADAEATTQVFQHFLSNTSAFEDTIQPQLAAAEAFNGFLQPEQPSQPAGQTIQQPNEPLLLSRAQTQQAREAAHNGGWFAGLVDEREPVASSTVENYFSLLDRVLLDRLLTTTEQDQLLTFAKDNNIGSQGLQDLHEEYLSQLLELAWADGVITEEERTIVLAVARALGIPSAAAEEALQPQAVETGGRHHSSSPVYEDTREGAIYGTEDHGTDPGMGPLQGIVLRPGDRVTVTGARAYSTSDWTHYFDAHGVVLAGLSKKTKVLIAADPDSQSGKAQKARAYGIPIVAEDVARDILRFTD
ncbi:MULTISPECIES: exonuclease domain-containing protein [unclassified Corynebacterium]|uniref:exonuclease domain-containing protein n=1 Tax=unclassified Corynebacterium TaxID=2624378 RepID=UPI001787FDA0|nr:MULTISPECIES: exonuclease domain-containing protein [unclassified Corynebacterium]